MRRIGVAYKRIAIIHRRKDFEKRILIYARDESCPAKASTATAAAA
jgi:hypothetical protein